ncbi:sulfatase [Segniliparus rotundus DSM 44985]|uniref:Sulfatase n=1 Tax=Segniliparus rotundus (strain ATCC BAA-972 / CDC 1076 / CIP 108378 / DSM 44985 / JCM 13578) TaxID=640132 RepID=D6Z8T2_SEGRD|nr:sulfatase-like hydrolase/transferase [Segniliparus rotundus]ADG98362.1 sulfatase [Segniliparus rotundus DSM 44985]
MAEINRRDLLIGGAAVSAAAAGLGTFELMRAPGADTAKPNILVLVCDQLRAPQWFPEQHDLDALLPNMAKLRAAGVSFESHYSASNMCTPSRGVMTTGLYSHQTGCLYTFGGPKQQPLGDSAGHALTDESTLSPKFPTWGSMLREQGYRTWWWGKWHLGAKADARPGALEEHGFSGGTCPSPNGAPHQGLDTDGAIVDQFAGWFEAEAGKGPWCTTVSLVNPHDICYWPKWQEPAGVPRRFTAPAPNFETPDDLVAHGKPALQRDYQQFMHTMLGPIPARGEEADQAWARQLDVYLWLQQQVDSQIGRVLDTLASRPAIERDTIVVFTADHGEYGGSHGLGGKGAAAYDEAIRVPLCIRDPSGRLVPERGGTRGHLTSSVDLAPLVLTLGAGGSQWRGDPRYAHLRDRADIAAIARDPAARGRPWIAHVTDDLNIEEFGAVLPTAAPGHIMAVRTRAAKLAVYSRWRTGTMDIDPQAPNEREYYDYATDEGRQEIVNQAGQNSPGEEALHALLIGEVIPEVHARLPGRLAAAREEGLADLLAMQTARKQLAQKALGGAIR